MLTPNSGWSHITSFFRPYKTRGMNQEFLFIFYNVETFLSLLHLVLKNLNVYVYTCE